MFRVVLTVRYISHRHGEHVREAESPLGGRDSDADEEVDDVDGDQPMSSSPTGHTPASKKTNAPSAGMTVKATDLPALDRGSLPRKIP